LKLPRALGCFVLLAAAVLASPPRVQASPLFELVGSTFGSGGFNGRAYGPASSSAYFNPAFLPQAKAGLELGVFILNDAISITLDARQPAYDIPLSALERFGTDNPGVPTSWLQNGCDPQMGGNCLTELQPHPRQSDGSSGNTKVYQTLGLVSHVWPRYLSLGLYAMVPYGPFTQAHSYFVDEREQFYTNSLHPEFYGDRLTPVSLAFGAGSQVLDWMSVGLSFTLSLSNTADATAFVGNSAKIADTLQLSTKVDVAASVAPHLAMLFQPLDSLDLSLTLHSPQKMVIDTAFSTYLPNGDLQRAVRPATHSWLPWTLGFGGAYELFEDDRNLFALTGTLTFERWSQYLNRQSERPLKNYDFSDIVTGSLGARYTRDHIITAFLDTNYRPSPVPLQTGRTNYVDNNRLGFVAGANYDLELARWKALVRFGGQFQAHFLLQRHQTKFDPTSAALAGNKYSQLVIDEWPDDAVDISTGQVIAEARGLQTNNPGWPGFSSQGTILGGTLSVSLLY
jgi:long-chain fatty acid transport protein